MEMDIDLDDIENLLPNTFNKYSSSCSDKKGCKTLKSGSKSPSLTIPKLQKQLEFYFSDANLYNDSFLRKLVLKSGEQRVEIETLLISLLKEHYGENYLILKANNDEYIKFICECVKGSRYIRLTKDKLAIKRKKKFDNRTTEELIAFTIRIDGELPSLETIEKAVYNCRNRSSESSDVNKPNKPCKFNGIYVKSFGTNAHCIYIGFLKHRYTECFRDCFSSQQITCFDYSCSSLISLKEAGEMKRRLKKEISKFVDSSVTGINNKNISIEKEEELSQSCFLKISKIPAGSKKYQIREALDCDRPSYIQYDDKETAVIRFKNSAMRTKFLESRNGAEILIKKNCVDIVKESNSKSFVNKYYQSCLIEEIDEATAQKIIKEIKDQRSSIDEIKAELKLDNKKYKPWSKYCGRKRRPVSKRKNKAINKMSTEMKK